MLFDKRLVRVGVACLVFVLSAVSCTRKPEGADDPKRRLNEYISESFAVKSSQDRARLSVYLTGDAKTRLDSWSEEQFRAAFVESKRKFIKLAFKEAKAVSDAEVGITYELTYQGNEAKITNRKLAQMVRKDGQWLIKDVRNIKELVEYQNEMSLP